MYNIMLDIRLKKILYLIIFFVTLFAIYELSNSDKKEATTAISNINSEPSPLSKVSGEIKSKSGLTPLFEGFKVVHIDLKGAPVKTSYYKQLFSLIKDLGASGVLMEYEDMFPYSNPYISANNAYNRTDIETILGYATEYNLDVIPLIPTFGHLEFVLKLKRFKHLREVPKYPQVICPTNNKTSLLIKGMIEDIIELHPDSRYLHIGSDEVYHLGECSRCVEAMAKKNWTKQQLFFSHVTMIARYVKKRYPKVKVLMWDDEFRHASLQELQNSKLGSLVEPVIWKYTPSVDQELSDQLWDKYAQVFRSVWFASAFKGATAPDTLTTNINFHLDNHRGWMRLVEKHSSQVNMKGIMLTGWQRFDHFAVLCELLPVGLPSLAVNLGFLAQGNIDMDEVPRSVLKRLSCGPGLLYSTLGASCKFPGAEIYELVHQLSSLKQQVSLLLQTNEAKGWFSQYNVRSQFSNPLYVEKVFSDATRFKIELDYMKDELMKAMKEVFDPYTVSEWEFTHLRPLEERLTALVEASRSLHKPTFWPRRPIAVDQNNRTFSCI